MTLSVECNVMRSLRLNPPNPRQSNAPYVPNWATNPTQLF